MDMDAAPGLGHILLTCDHVDQMFIMLVKPALGFNKHITSFVEIWLCVCVCV